MAGSWLPKTEEYSMAVDPVCKMNVSESDARYNSVHDGIKYYFCSAACKQEFDKTPSKYVK
ncbi:MAG: YHS domain-containing protein [Candidatus Bathyarchaeia archaeon]